MDKNYSYRNQETRTEEYLLKNFTTGLVQLKMFHRNLMIFGTKCILLTTNILSLYIGTEGSQGCQTGRILFRWGLFSMSMYSVLYPPHISIVLYSIVWPSNTANQVLIGMRRKYEGIMLTS